MKMATKGAAKKAKKPERPAGIPGDVYRVQLRGNAYYVINEKTRVAMGGPFKTRDAAQRRADELERTAGR
jgi:hypothetical protein